MATKRIPSLDGIRAFLLFIVLLSHLAGTVGFPITSRKTIAGAPDLAFRAFFIISGFLITGILLHDFEKRQTISLGKFYFRRVLRLFPAFYVYVAVIVLLHVWSGLVLHQGDVAHALTYTMNYHHDRAWSLGHSWSLSVEEQFYLLWPLMLWLLKPRWGLLLAAVFVCAGPFLRLGSWWLFPDSRAGVGESFPTIADSIAVGCLLARGRSWLDENVAYARFRASPYFLIVPLILAASSRLLDRPTIHMVVGQTVTNVGIALCVDWCMRYPDGAVGRVLNWTPMRLIGTWSYSMYLWQQLFLNRTSDWWICAFPQNIALASIAGVVSFYLVERPSLQLREWLEPRLFRRAPNVGERGESEASQPAPKLVLRDE